MARAVSWSFSRKATNGVVGFTGPESETQGGGALAPVMVEAFATVVVVMTNRRKSREERNGNGELLSQLGNRDSGIDGRVVMGVETEWANGQHDEGGRKMTEVGIGKRTKAGALELGWNRVFSSQYSLNGESAFWFSTNTMFSLLMGCCDKDRTNKGKWLV